MNSSVIDINNLLEEREEKNETKKARAKTEIKAKPIKKLTKKEQQIAELASQTVLPDHYFTVWSELEFDEMCTWLENESEIAVDTETMGVNVFVDDIVGISFYAPHKGYYLPLAHIDEDLTCLTKAFVTPRLKRILEDTTKKFYLHNAKFDCHILYNWLGIDLTPHFDTMIAAGLLNENTSKALKDIAPLYRIVKEADKYGTIFGKTTFDRVPIKLNNDRTGNLASYYAIKDTELTFKLMKYFESVLERHNLVKIKTLFYDVEMPFLHIVTKAERQGVRLDSDYMNEKVAKQLNEEVEQLRIRIESYVGQINLNSPAQLSNALYNELKLPRVNEKKPDSTDAKTLKKLRGEHEIIGLLLDYRGKVKLKTAFADKLPLSVVNDRVHTSFGTLGTKTGRMSSRGPNLQQIPARIGGLIRNAFISDEGRLLASIDFSGQELRLLTHITQDKTLMDIYLNDGDVHSMTAVGMWNRQNPSLKVDYGYFQYCREMSGHFMDADGKIVKERFRDNELVRSLYKGNIIKSFDSEKLQNETALGVKFEKIRKSAKTVNFGRVKHLCRIKTLLSTVKPKSQDMVIPC